MTDFAWSYWLQNRIDAALRASWHDVFQGSRSIHLQVGFSATLLGDVAREQGDYATARTLYEESLAIKRELGDKLGITQSLEAFAALASVRREQSERTARLWGAADALREAIGTPLPPDEREKQECEMTRVRERLGEDAFAAAWAQGRTVTMEQAIEYAME